MRHDGEIATDLAAAGLEPPRQRKMGSIAHRLFLSAAVLSFAILLTAGLVLTAIYRRTAEASFDQRLGVYLRALVADIATPGEGGREGTDELSDPQFELALSGWYWQVTRLDGDKPRIRGSRSLFAARLPRLAAQGVPAGLGGARRGYVKGPDERTLRMLERVIDAGDQGLYLVQVAAKSDELDSQIRRFEFDLVVTFALLAVALLGSSALQLRYGLRPLRLLREGVASIRRGDAEKIEGDFPQDLAPLAGEINLLIDANRAVAERARTQVGNLAHALKTPLSVIVNEASADAGPLAGKVEEQAQVMRDQITFYLDRARVAVRAGAMTGSTEVAPVIDALLRTFQKVYRERGVNFSAAVPDSLRFLGERQDLEEMIGNLVDNAGKWAASAVLVSVEPEAPQSAAERAFLRIVIDDDGPGLPADQREGALRRGRRLDETKPGSGLGLSIVADLSGLYGGALTLDDSPRGGMRATLRLPAASHSGFATSS
jgi:signal transduction histidine kinase